jgi:hypothetical protein
MGRKDLGVARQVPRASPWVGADSETLRGTTASNAIALKVSECICLQEGRGRAAGMSPCLL